MHNRLWQRLSGGLILALIFLVTTGAEKRPASTFRIHVQTVEQGAVGTQVLPVTLTNPPKQIMVRAQPDMNERDILRLDTAEAEYGLAMRIQFDEHGRTVLNALTLENQGRILVVFLNGRVLYAPVIDKALSDGVLIIPRGVFPEEIEPLKAAIKYARK